MHSCTVADSDAVCSDQCSIKDEHEAAALTQYWCVPRAEAEPVQLRLLPGGRAHHRQPRRRRVGRRSAHQHRRHDRRRRHLHDGCVED